MNFNKLILLLIITFGTLLSCTIDDDDTPTIAGAWQVKNISGGLAGIDDTYTQGTIKWTFNSQNFTLTVVNNNPLNTTIYDGFAPGIYSYSITKNNDSSYLVIEGNEFGESTLTVQNLIINQNKLSTGTGNDGFILKLER